MTSPKSTRHSRGPRTGPAASRPGAGWYHQGGADSPSRGQERLARQALPSGHGRSRDRRTRRGSNLTIRGPLPGTAPAIPPLATAGPGGTPPVPAPVYSVGEEVATRKAYGDALQRSAVITRGLSPSTARSAIPLTRTNSPGRILSATSRCSSPNSRWSAAAVGLSVRKYVPFASTLRHSSPVPTISSGWPPSPRRISAWPARTRASRSALTGHPRWHWKTWR